MARGPQILDISGKTANLQSRLEGDISLAATKDSLNTTKRDQTLNRVIRDYNQAMDDIETQYREGVKSAVGNFTKNGISFLFQMTGMLKDEQTQQANYDITTYTNELNRMLNESLMDGTTGYMENENGQLVFQVAPKIQEAYDNYVAGINNSNMMSSVKEKALLAFDSSWKALQYNASTSALDKAYTNRNELFNANLNNALVSDSQLLASNGGVLPEGASFSGIALIQGRNDWSQEVKDAKVLQYTQQVVAQSAIESGSRIAVTKGLQAASEHIYSVPGLTEQQRQSAYAYAQQSLGNRQSAVATSAVAMMENAIMEGSSPNDVYKTVLENLAGEAPETRSYVYSQMKTAQQNAVIEIANNQYNQDVKGGLEELQKTYDDYKSGKYDYLFSEIPEVEQAFVSKYEAAIENRTSELASTLNTTTESIEEADSSILSTLEASEENIMARIESGTLSPADGVTLYGDLASQAATQLQLPESKLSQQTSQISFLSTLAENYLPANWKTPINDALDSVYAALQLNGSASQLTDEQITARNNISNYSFGLIADMFYNNANYTLDDALAEIQNLKESFLMSGIGGSYEGLSVPEAADGKPVKKNTTAAINLFNSYRSFTGLVYSDDAEAMIQNEVNGVPAAPKYKFISEEVETNFNNGAQALMPLIAAFSGEDISKITYAPEALADGSMIACPVYYAGGEAYRIRSEQIQIRRGDTWQHAGFVSYKEDEMKSQGRDFRERDNGQKAEPSETRNTEKPDSWYEQHDPEMNQSAGKKPSYKGITRDSFSQMLHADISVFDGIETKEDAIKLRDEILNEYNSPTLRYEMDKFIKEIWG